MLSFTEQRLLSSLEPSSVRYLAEPAAEKPFSQEPNFLLFNRERDIVLVICPGGSRVNPRRLQRTNEPDVRASLLSFESAEALGFTSAKVHPFFEDPSKKIARIFIDAVLFVQSIRFPDSLILLPRYDHGRSDGKYVVQLRPFLRALIGIFGEARIEIANVSDDSWPNPVLKRLIDEAAVSTRFAPTPSNTLHLGNARGALIAYLSALKVPGSKFFVRFDDTDLSRTKEECVEEILNELSWLGLSVPSAQVFRQSDAKSRVRYSSALSRLERAGLVSTNSDGSKVLGSLPPERYFNIVFDWKSGPRVEHTAPATKDRDEKTLPIFRAGGEIPFYRFSGAVDDIELSTHVFRDKRQEFLSTVQNHIRVALGWANLQSSKRNYFEAHWSLPLSAYFHLSTVTDEGGQVLSKREGAGSYMLRSLIHEEKLPGQPVLSLLLSTILPHSQHETLRKGLSTISELLAGEDFLAALRVLAQSFSLDAVTKSRESIRLDLRRLEITGRAHLQSVSESEFRSTLTRLSETKPSAALAFRLYQHRRDLSDWRQAVLLIDPPQPLLENTMTPQDTLSEKMKIRRLLTGKDSGPPLSTIFAVLEPEVAAARLLGQPLEGFLATTAAK